MSTIVQSPPFLWNPFAPGADRVATSVRLVDPARDPANVLLASCLSALIIVGMVAMRDDMLHWFLLPVFLCGALIGPDMVGWLRGKVDIFDPVGILGAYGYFFFFIAPLLTVMWNFHTRELVEPPDWIGWIGWMSVINAFGLVIYLAARKILPASRPRTVWRLQPSLFFAGISIALPVTFAFQIYVFNKFGGVLAFMGAYSNGNADDLVGMGWQFLIAEYFPIFLGLLFLVWKRDFLRQRSWGFLVLLVIGFFVVKMLFGGLRGSRSNTVWGVFWLVGAIHLWVRPVPRKAIVVGVLLLGTFMYYYGFYKAEGVRAFDAIDDPSRIGVMEEKSGRTLDAALLGDMARTEIQSQLLYRLWSVGDYDYSFGATYAEAFDILIPRSIWPDRPDGKVRKGTEALYGRDVYNARVFRASQVYGLAGEAMLNFPPIFAPLSFFILALVVLKARNLMLADADDIRWLLLPVLANLVVVVLVGDVDNLLWFFFEAVLGPLVLLRASCRPMPRVSGQT
ncbi:MAG TPA: hypothetical protein VII95_11405 [Terriglobales bacterium]|jgi:hypothetical protein